MRTFLPALSFLAALALHSPSAVAQQAPPNPEASSGRPGVGPVFSLPGPNSIIGGGIAIAPMRMLEPALWVGFNSAKGSSDTGLSKASASISVINIMARAKVWFFGRHSLIADPGVGISRYQVKADGSNTVGDSLKYERAGSPIVGHLGLGYGFRADNGFRFTASLGALYHFGQVGNSTVTTTGSFSQADRDKMKLQLDEIVDDLAKPRPYLELSVGWLF